MVESICAIGFSGHRELSDIELVREKITQLLDELERKACGRLVAVSSVAIGSDILFVETCLARGFPWIAVLPMPPSLFFNEKDFRDSQVRANAMSLLKKAARVEVTNPTANDALKYNSEYRKIAFSDLGQRIVDRSDVLIAVFQHGHDLSKPGGSGKVVSDGKRRHRPVAAIDPNDGKIEHHHWNPPFVGSLITELRSLCEVPMRIEFVTPESSPSFRAVVDWFSRLSAAARRSVPRLRSLSSTAVLLHGSAVLLALALITLPLLFVNHQGIHFAEWLEVVFAGLAFIATLWFLRGRPHERAARYRLCAEICRSLIATWHFPDTHREIFRGFPTEYRDFVRMLLNLRCLETPPAKQSPMRETEQDEAWRGWAAYYHKQRLEKQRRYYSNEQKKARQRLRRLEPLSWICSGVGLLLVTGIALTSSLGYSTVESLRGIPDLGKVAFPFLAGVVISLLAVHEATRRKSRYAEMLAVLDENIERLHSAPHKDAARDVVVDIERALLSENIEWANAAKYPAAS